MTLPKGLMALLGRAGDTEIGIVALALSFLFFVILLFIFRSIFIKLGIKKVFGLSIPPLVLGVLGFLIVFSAASSNPIACQSCHPMRASVKELRSSSHKGVGCLSCHQKSIAFAVPIQKLEQARMIFKYVTRSYKQPVLSAVGNDACLVCHGDVIHGIKTRRRVTMSHREVIKAGISCTECHEGIAHKKKTADRTVSMMEKCSSCHNDEEASSRCEVCHLDNVWLGMNPSQDWGIAHGKNWIRIHGSRSLYICKNCHYEKECKRCHDVEIPHPEGWSYVHGEEAKERREGCNTCHKVDSFCRGCHRINMPHPDGWLPLHQWEVEIAGEKVCLSCHFSKDCSRCHDKHNRKIELMRKSDR